MEFSRTGAPSASTTSNASTDHGGGKRQLAIASSRFSPPTPVRDAPAASRHAIRKARQQKPFDAKREIFRNGALKIPNPASGINVNESLSTSCKEKRLIVLSARGIFTEYELQNARSEIAPCKNQYRAVVGMAGCSNATPRCIAHLTRVSPQATYLCRMSFAVLPGC